MYKEKLLDNVYAIDMITYSPEKIRELQPGAVIHFITHHINDEKVIRDTVRVLLDMDCKVFHVFGEYHNLWTGEIKAQGCNSAVVIDYHIELQEFEMDLVTHLIEKSECMQHNRDMKLEDRLDYLLYDDIGFLWMIQDDVKEYKEPEHDK